MVQAHHPDLGLCFLSGDSSCFMFSLEKVICCHLETPPLLAHACSPGNLVPAKKQVALRLRHDVPALESLVLFGCAGVTLDVS